MTDYDLIVLGAGPAGMTAAQVAAADGARVLILDEQPELGGQIYRNILKASPKRQDILGSSYTEGKRLAVAMDHENIDYRPMATVWNVTEAAEVTFSIAGKAKRKSASHVVIATGALERPVPVPGWTLSGVMTAGAAQILLKAHGLVVDNAVLAGSGPLLYLIAVQMIKAGCPPKALLETQTTYDRISALRYLLPALTSPNYLRQGAGMLASIKEADIPRYQAVKNIVIEGEEHAEAISFEQRGKRQQIECDTVLLHAGVVPNTVISQSLRLDHFWDGQQFCFRPVVNDQGISSNPLFSIAGDGAGIGGARAAHWQGKIAALGALKTLGIGDKEALDKELRIGQKKLNSEMAIRPFLDLMYPPASQLRRPANETVICRCENILAGDIRDFAKKGCMGPNQAKAFGRAGMGPCQGRYCGLSVTEILAQENNQTQEETGALRGRSPLKPVSLGEIASLAPEDDNEDPSAKLRNLTK